MKNLELCPIKDPLIFDTHSHYDDHKFDGVRDELLSSLKDHGVCGIIICGCDYETSKYSLSIAEKYDYTYAAVGIHPLDADKEINISDIEKLALSKKCVAIGEVGLDYYWNKDNKERQIKVFEDMLILSKKLDLPIIIHDRDAHQDTLELLKKHRPKGVLHCFSGSVEMAREILKLGMYIGVGGVVTFKNARKLPEVIESVPLDRILLETDCPYLAPEPFRGQLCHSAMIGFTAEKTAELKGVSTLELLKIARENTKNLFNV